MSEEARAQAFSEAKIEFPVSFDLRIIYTLAENPELQGGLEAILARLEVPCSLIQGAAKPGARYGKMGARITLDSLERMHALYAAVGALPGVKTVL
jgi:putative lipoic acid-binding regulatory protein